MSKQTIIEWQRDSVFIASGSKRSGGVEIDAFGCATAPDPTAETPGPSLQAQLRELAKKLDISKGPVTVIAPRESLEFRILTIPRGDADEIPDMVRFQATRQMANIGDTWPLDYVLLPDNPSADGISALAATISPAGMAEIESTCSDLGLTVAKVLARPVEIARLGVSIGELASQDVSLIIALSDTHADLLLATRGSLVQLRGTRLPQDHAALAGALTAEIRRSMMAAASFLNGQPIGRTVLLAAPDLAAKVETHVAAATGADVKVFDPAALLSANVLDRHEIAHRAAARLAAIGGALVDANPDANRVIDLKNFKRRRVRERNYRPFILGGTAAAVIVLAAFGWWWKTTAELDMEITDLKQKIASLKELNKNSSMMSAEWSQMERFLNGSINWLDQLDVVAQNIPPADNIVFANPSLELMPDQTTAQITVPVFAKTRDAIPQMEESLRSAKLEVAGNGMKELPDREYRWTSNETIRVRKAGWNPLAKKTTEPAKAKNAAPTEAKKPADDKTPVDEKAPGKVDIATADAPATPAPTQPVAAQPAADQSATDKPAGEPTPRKE